MNTDVERLLREGMERLAATTQAPAGLAGRAGRRLRRRRLTVRAAVACGTAAVAAATTVAVITGAGGPAWPGAGGARVRTVAYVLQRVENALADQHLVFAGRTVSDGGLSITWVYGARHRWEELTGNSCGHALRSGACTHRGDSEPYLAVGTALIGGKLTGVYVTYYNHKWSLMPQPAPASACSPTGALEMGGPPVPTSHWPDFISAMLRCGAARVTGHARVDGVETTKITGSSAKVKLSPGYAKTVGEKWARAQWTLYVNPETYLPVRLDSSTQAFGGPAPSTRFASTTDVRWLPPTTDNIAQTLVTIPVGFHQVNSPGDQ